MKPVELLPAAEAELDAAVEWYEERAAGFGLALADAVERVLALIREQPNRYPRWQGDERYRKANVSRFPYLVFYEELDDIVLVIAVAHGRRKPGYWANRRRKRGPEDR